MGSTGGIPAISKASPPCVPSTGGPVATTGGDAGKRMSPSQQIAIKSDDLFGLWETVIGDGYCEGQNVIGASAKVDLGQVPETADR